MKTIKRLSAAIALSGVCTVAATQTAASGPSAEQAGVEGKGLALTGADAAKPNQKSRIKANPSLPPLAIEETGNVAKLPGSYPESWVLVDEASFFSMYGGKVIVLDVAEKRQTKRIKGLMDKHLLGNFTQSRTRGEYYIMESFHARGSRGPKTDVLAIYDKSTLAIKKEIVWPKPNRLQALPERYSMSVSGDEKYLYSSNFDPAASFTVIDLDSHKIVTEIGTPGCVMTYPVGNRSVASLCSNGGMLTTQLNEDGTLKSQQRMAPFFDTDQTPIFEHATIIDGIAYFPGFKGKIHAIDMRGDEAKYIETWDLLSDKDKSGHWRPSGLALNDYDDSGLLYTIFQPDGHEGSQTHGGTQVWVFDVKKKRRVRVIDTPNWAISLAVTRGKSPLLVVTNKDLNLDIFNAGTGDFIQTVADFGNVTPLLVHKSY